MAQGTRRLRLESLEHKKMLAGDVLASVVEGVLLIQGDELGNEIAVTSGEQPGAYEIRGLEGTTITLDGDNTTAQDDASVVVVEGVTRAIRANMGDGDDRVVLNDLQHRGNVSIRTGNGDDTVRIGSLVEEAESETEDSAEDAAEGPAVVIGRNLSISTGAGEDAVSVNQAAGRGRLRVATGDDDDTVRIGRRSLDATTDDEGEGETITDDEALGEAGDATPRDFGVRFRAGVQVRLGEGNDTTSVSDTATHRHVAVGGGEGDDTVRISGVHARSIHVRGGSGEGADTVAIRDSASRVLFAALGGGDDVLSLGGVRAQLALLSGGPGEADELNEVAENMIRRQRAVGFELPAVDPTEDEEQTESLSEEL